MSIVMLLAVIICACGNFFILASKEQENWLKWYRMRLEELKVHEERQQSLLDGEEGFSPFHIKVRVYFVYSIV